jgi:hypothetical protein
LGQKPDLKETNLDKVDRVIGSVDQGLAVATSLIFASSKLIFNSSRIVAKINGEPPFSKKALKAKGKGHKRNISTRFLQTQCKRIHPRFFIPLQQASTLTAAALPDGWPQGPAKNDKFRRRLTKTIRAWPKWKPFIKGLAREVVDFGYGFGTFFDEYEWRPTLIRMDKGFVPQGTEILDRDFQFYAVKWDYNPADLLKLVKDADEAGLDTWQKKACVQAINDAVAPALSPTFERWRDYEELIRQAIWSIAYFKAKRTIETYHLFAREYTGKVSHYVYAKNGISGGDPDMRLLYEKEDAFDSIIGATIPVTFGYGDGTIQGSWGAGQLLFDLANQLEIIRNDLMDTQLAQNKMKLVAKDGKNVNDIKMVVNDDYIVVSDAQMAGNQAALPANVESYLQCEGMFGQWAMQLVGNYVPPIPLQPSDLKAASVNAAMSQEQETQMDNLDDFLSQVAFIIAAMTKRLADPDSPDEEAKEFRAALLDEDQLTEEEVEKLANQPAIQSVTEFTPAAAMARAQFAASRAGGPSAALYDMRKLEEIQAQAVPGGQAVLDYALNPDPTDPTNAAAATRQQILENTSLSMGQEVPVVASDPHWMHMQAMKQPLAQAAQQGAIGPAQAGVKHYAAHYIAGVGQKSIPPDQVNSEKQYIAALEELIKQHIMAQQAAQAAKMAQAGAVPGGVPTGGAPTPLAGGVPTTQG